jgi:1-acyl-sn-glycerol-3-phosphate acyltransferase
MSSRAVDRILSLAGWTPSGQFPDVRKAVVVCAPHTSNWDGVLMLAGAKHFGIRFEWVGKHTLFAGPLGPIMRGLGGIAVDRRAASGQVQQLVEAFATRDSLLLAVAPEGTRGHAEHWKSGFHRIARAAGVPIVLGFLDYGRKQFGFGPAFQPTEDLHADMERIRAFYADKGALVPANVGPIRLKEEGGGSP